MNNFDTSGYSAGQIKSSVRFSVLSDAEALLCEAQGKQGESHKQEFL